MNFRKIFYVLALIALATSTLFAQPACNSGGTALATSVNAMRPEGIRELGSDIILACPAGTVLQLGATSSLSVGVSSVQATFNNLTPLNLLNQYNAMLNQQVIAELGTWAPANVAPLTAFTPLNGIPYNVSAAAYADPTWVNAQGTAVNGIGNGLTNYNTVQFKFNNAVIGLTLPNAIRIRGLRFNVSSLPVNSPVTVAITVLNGNSIIAFQPSPLAIGQTTTTSYTSSTMQPSGLVTCQTYNGVAGFITISENFPTVFKAQVTESIQTFPQNTVSSSGGIYLGYDADTATRIRINISGIPSGVAVWIPVGRFRTYANIGGTVSSVILTSTTSTSGSTLKNPLNSNFGAAYNEFLPFGVGNNQSTAAANTAGNMYIGSASTSAWRRYTGSTGNFDYLVTQADGAYNGINNNAQGNAAPAIYFPSYGNPNTTNSSAISAFTPTGVQLDTVLIPYGLEFGEPGATAPTAGTATVLTTVAPNATDGYNIGFVTPSTVTSQNLFTLSSCSTSLLYPYVTSAAGFNSNVSIANTTMDPFVTPNGSAVTTAQSGTCRLSLYGTNDDGSAVPSPVTTPSIAAGRVYTNSLTSIFGAGLGTAGFRGYMIAQCNFQLAHGYYSITNSSNTMLAGTLAEVLGTSNIVNRQLGVEALAQ